MYVLVLAVVMSKAYAFFRPICNGTMYHDQYYDTLTLFQQYGKAHHLVMHESTGHLFFSYGNEFLKRQVVGCHIENRTCWNVTEAGQGFTVFYNRVKDHLYIGGNNGIYKYNITTNTGKLIGAKKKKIWSMFIKKNRLYYIEYPSHHLYSIADSTKSVKVGNIKYYNYFVSKHLVHYFTNNLGELYKIEKPAEFYKEAILLNHKLTVRQITEDIYGVIYVCAKEGIYVDDEPYRRVNKIAEFGDLYSVAIINKLSHVKVQDEFIVIYSNEHGIYQFHPSPYTKYCNVTPLGAIRMASQSTSKNLLSFSVKLEYD